MKARIKFQKYGAMKFIGHLDVMRYFQKAFRRANIDNEYSKGFSPHQIMSFAAPLGVGLTSDGEYLDVQLLSGDAPEVMIERMNAVLTDGFKIVGFHPLLDREENKKAVTAMSLVGSADYLVSLKDGYSLGQIKNQDEFVKAFSGFMAEKEIVIDKKTKNSEKAVDIRPMITLIAFDQMEYEDKLKDLVKPMETIASGADADTDSWLDASKASDTGATTFSGLVTTGCKPKSVADVYENGLKVYLQLETGSAANLKPELVMEAFYEYLGLPFEKFAWQVHRIEVYTREEESGKLISLDHLER
jgi:radical SAM-linked protein